MYYFVGMQYLIEEKESVMEDFAVDRDFYADLRPPARHQFPQHQPSL